MRVGDARRVAQAWVQREATRLPGFQGAYVGGSANWLPDDAELPAASDLDLYVVIDIEKTDGGGAAAVRRKIVSQGVLIEVSTIPLDLLRTPEQVLGDFALAGGFLVPSVLADPTGHLTRLQEIVSARFAEPEWVRKRCEHAQDRTSRYLDALNEGMPLHLQIIVWAFGTSVVTLIPLVAALRNPTVRRRYVAVRELLAEHGRLGLYERMLGLLGCANLSRDRVEHHLVALADLYDATVPVLRSEYPFAADVSRSSRHVAIDGSQDLIDQGLHREAVWWLVVTFARCREVLATDAPALLPRYDPAFRALLADLGIVTFAGLQRSVDRTRALLPEVWAASESLIGGA